MAGPHRLYGLTAYVEATRYNRGMGRIRAPIWAALIILACATTVRPQQTADQLFESARTAQIAGKIAEAESAYRVYLERFGPRPEIFANLGVVLASRENYPEAIRYYQQALQLDPSLTPLHLNLGLAYFKQGQYEPAIEQFDLLLQSYPDNRKAAQLRAIALLETEHFAEAEKQFQALTPGDLSITVGLATALVRQQKTAEAKAVLEPVLARADSAEVQLILGQADLNEGHLDEALAAFERARRLNPELRSLRLNIGMVYWRQRKTDQALAEWRAEYAAQPGNFEAVYTLGAAVALNPSEQQQAEDYLRKAIALRPYNSRANYQLAKVIWQSRKDKEAAALLERATQADPTFREALLLSATVLRTLGREAEAKRASEQAERLSRTEMSRHRDSFAEIEAPVKAPSTTEPNPMPKTGPAGNLAGANACALCHAARVRLQSATPHAHTLSPYTGDHFAGRKLREGTGLFYEYSGNRVSVSRGEESTSAEIMWAFGAGTQAVTPVIRRDGQWVEHRVSWYRDGDRFRLTPGHDPRPPLDLEESLGVVQSPSNAERCFGCHQPNGEPGVHCQGCHGDGAEHRRHPAKGNIRRDMSVALCAVCHRSPDMTFASAQPEIEDARSIRFAPVGFQASKCFQSSRNFTCVSCHDPHGEPAKRSVAEVCQACHRVARSSCPRTPECASCHMRSSSPIPGLHFTDHRIRIYSQ